MKISSRVLICVSSLVYVGLAVGAASRAQPPAVGENTVIATFHAEGAQIYQCKPNTSQPAGTVGALAWQFREPIATLIVAGQSVGRHYAGPSWELVDGGAVKGRVVKSMPAPTANDISWLELEVVDHRNKGVLSEAVTVLRKNTKGGVAQGSCDSEGKYLSVPYTADYVFLRKSN
ncbi:DUF3455 domain-containing protein [Bradyrhizobium sp. UFLA05-153]|uniref:DUF3455 domain-containing protein n=1 Tax=Bradyrhizobium sp. Ec3.3 TaxID=189753 RepID=UPI0004813971|nr:DUF3455 domain-containing protein [Bradyrhizobium sp. Ec3.3]